MLSSIIYTICQDNNITPPPLLIPKYFSQGDIAILSLKLSNKHKTLLLTALKKNKLIDRIEIKSGYINIFFSTSFLLKTLIRVSKKSHVCKKDHEKKAAYVIEHTSPNPNKSLHLGHLRNNVLGMSIANIWEFCGIRVIRDCIDNNRGIAIAKLMWGYLYFARTTKKSIPNATYWNKHKNEWKTPNIKEMSYFIDTLYTQAAQLFKEDKQIENTIRNLALEWEKGNKDVIALWKHVLSYSYTTQQQTLKRLQSTWDFVWHESDHYVMGKEYIEKGLKMRVFKKTPEQTIITQFQQKLPNTVVLKSDGTSLYITQDIALTDLKIKKFKPNRLFWVIGPEQTLALKQLFMICDQLNIGKKNMFTHIPYGLLSIKGKGKMSSRTGNIIYIDEVLDRAIHKAKQIILKNSRLTQTNIQKAAEIVGVGAVKYSILKVGRNTPIQFDIDLSVTLDGNSGPYIQYVYARIQSILKKVKAKNTKHNSTIIFNEYERNLIVLICRFSDIIENAAQNYSPNLLCNYLYSLSQEFNVFYEKCPVIKSDKEFQRVLIIKAVANILKTGLNLLGIKTLNTL